MDEEEPVAEAETQAEEDEEEAAAVQTFRGPYAAGPARRPGWDFQRLLRMRLPGGRGLDPSVLGFMESRFGLDLGHVRVHADAPAARLSSLINAHAFTLGNNVFFGAGMYSPQTASGRRLLAHELVHTIQQQPERTRQKGDSDGIEIGSPADRSEIEAEQVTRRVSAMGPLGKTSPQPAVSEGKEPPDTLASRGLRQSHLTSGGTPLPRPIRDELEPRFGRDFNRVRIHTGQEAAQLNREVGSSAFTYGSHIWLGQGETLGATETMAHELAHVVQQSAPPRLDGVAHQGHRSSLVVRGKFYLEPSAFNGVKTHRLVLPEVRKANQGNVFVEAPVPNATRKGSGAGHPHGRADLLAVSGTGRRALGVQFDGQNEPQPLPGPSKSKGDNPLYSHARRSAPFSDGPGLLKRISKGPTKILIADLKPAPASPSGTRGKTQIQNYIDGLAHAHTQANAWADRQSRKPKHWKPMTAGFWTGVKVPSKLRGPNFQNQSLVVKEFTWSQDKHDSQKWKPSMTVFKPPKPVKGYLVVEKSKSSPSIIQYRWKPSFAYKPSRITSAVGKLTADLDPLLKDLRTIKTKKVSGRFLRRTGSLLGRVPPLLQRKVNKPDTKVKDEFVAKDWERRRSVLKNKYGSTKGAADARLQFYLSEVDKDSGGKDKLAAVPTDPHLKTVGRLEFWTGGKARFLGILREKFGGVAVKVLNAAHSFRSKLLGLLEKKKGKEPSPTSYGKVAVRAILRALSRIAGPLFRQSVASVAASFRSGVSKQLHAAFPVLQDPSKLFTEMLKEEAKRFPLVAQLQRAVASIKTKVEALKTELEKKFGPLFDFLQALRSKAETVGTIIKVAMVAIQCASPPILGCLKLAASTAISYLADRVLSWCPIQKKFQALVLKLDAVRNLPRTLAKKFVDLLPSDPILKVGGTNLSAQNLFDKTVLENTKPAKNVECDDPTKTGTIDPRHAAIADLMTEMGCDHDPQSDSCKKVAALGELMTKRGVHSRNLTPKEIRGLALLLKSKGFTAEDLRAAALASGRGKTMTVQEFLKKLPGWVKQGQAIGRFSAAQQKLGPRAGKSLAVGELSLRVQDLDWDRLKKTGQNTGISAVQRVSEHDLVFGTLDLVDVKNFRCPTPAKITFDATTRNVRLTDAAGNPVKTSHEGHRSGWKYTGGSDRFKKARKLLCKP